MSKATGLKLKELILLTGCDFEICSIIVIRMRNDLYYIQDSNVYNKDHDVPSTSSTQFMK